MANKNNMTNNKKSVKNNEEFSVIFGGDTFIEAGLYTKSINIIERLIKESGNAVGIKNDKNDTDGSLGLEIKANKEGSFDTLLSLTLSIDTPTLVSGAISHVSEILNIILSFFIIKRFLKGKKEKSIQDLGNNESEVENEYGDKDKFSTNAVNIYFTNSNVDKLIAELFRKNNREYIVLKLNGTSITIPRNAFGEMSIIISGDDDEIVETRKPDPTEEELDIKKPDLLWESKWGFLFQGKLIEAIVKDDIFLGKIHKGMKLNAGLKIRCMLQIEEEINKKGKTITKKYTVLEVMGEPFPAINKPPKGELI